MAAAFGGSWYLGLLWAMLGDWGIRGLASCRSIPSVIVSLCALLVFSIDAGGLQELQLCHRQLFTVVVVVGVRSRRWRLGIELGFPPGS